MAPLIQNRGMNNARYRSERGLQLRLDGLSQVLAPVRRTGQTTRVQSRDAVSLFSGAGGLDLGIEQAGYTTRVAVEWDHDAADTMEKNASEHFPDLQAVLRADLYPGAQQPRSNHPLSGSRWTTGVEVGGSLPLER